MSGRALDLHIRIEPPSDPQMCRALRERYLAARDAAGLVGELRFRPGAWVDLTDLGGTAPPEPDHGLISAASRRRAAA